MSTTHQLRCTNCGTRIAAEASSADFRCPECNGLYEVVYPWSPAVGGAVAAEVRIYNLLFARADPGADGDVFADLNPDSLEILPGALVEPSLAALPAGETVQFERQGYFCVDRESTGDKLVFNRTVGLRDSYARAR